MAVLGAGGCWAALSPEPSSNAYPYDQSIVARANEVPSDIWAYPHVPWGHSYAYLFNGRWYYPTEGGWVVYRQEPVELSRERTRIQDAPRVRPYERSPAYGYPRSVPPPAPERYGP